MPDKQIIKGVQEGSWELVVEKVGSAIVQKRIKYLI